MKESTTLRINRSTHNAIAKIAEQKGVTMQDVIASAIEAYRRSVILEKTNTAYSNLFKEASELASYKAEIESMDGSLADKLGDL